MDDMITVKLTNTMEHKLLFKWESHLIFNLQEIQFNSYFLVAQSQTIWPDVWK